MGRGLAAGGRLLRRLTCSACGSESLEQFLDLGLSPIADAYLEDLAIEPEFYPLQLAVCTTCWLVQLLEVVDPAALFGSGYSFYSSASAPLSDYHYDYARSVQGMNGRLRGRLVVEIGCNDGDFLRHFGGYFLHDYNTPVLGIDPSTGPLAVAEQRGIEVLAAPFTAKLAEEIQQDYGQAGIVVANHVLAHVENVSDVLEGISHILADDGHAYIEVQYLPDLLVNNAFDLVYHEHRNFFSLSSLASAAQRWGLYVTRRWLTSRQGGSLRVELSKGRVEHVLGYDEQWLRSIETYRGFQGRVNRIRDRLAELVERRSVASPIVGYGAPAKATTLLNFCGLDDALLDCVLDTTKAKQGRFIPGVNLKIVAPESINLHDYEAVLLLAWNYAGSIMRKHRGYSGDWIVPIPAPVVL